VWELIAVRFDETDRASEVLGQLEALDAYRTIELRDAVAVYRTDDGKLHLDQSVQPTAWTGAAKGGLVGALVGALLAIPFTAGASAAAAAAAAGAGALGLGIPGAAIGASSAGPWREAHGIPEQFAREVAAQLEPGQSAVLALARLSDPVATAEHFRGHGGTVLRTTMTPEQHARIQRVLEARDDRAM
jgi:uncharacterized membrane protein